MTMAGGKPVILLRAQAVASLRNQAATVCAGMSVAPALAIGQQRQSLVCAIRPRARPDAKAPLAAGELMQKRRGAGCLPETHVRVSETENPLGPGDADVGHAALFLAVIIVEVRQH